MTVIFPTTPNVGDTITGPFNEIYEWDGGKWTLSEGGAAGGGAKIDVGPTPPASPGLGTLWWSTNVAKLFMWTGHEWVIVVNTPGGGGETDLSLYMKKAGVTDGSNAPTGEIGEYIEEQTTATMWQMQSTYYATVSFGAGDWEVTGCIGYVDSAGMGGYLGFDWEDPFIPIHYVEVTDLTGLYVFPTRRYNVNSADGGGPIMRSSGPAGYMFTTYVTVAARRIR